MIDTAHETTCKTCGRPMVQAPGGHRKRVYCNAVCKMKERRRLLAAQQQARANQAQAQIAALEKQVRALEARLAALQMVNERFRNDTQVRAFGSWLEKQARYYAQMPFGQRFLDGRKNQVLPPRASRAAYEAIMYHQLGYSAEDIETFREAWREMLKTQV